MNHIIVANLTKKRRFLRHEVLVSLPRIPSERELFFLFKAGNSSYIYNFIVNLATQLRIQNKMLHLAWQINLIFRILSIGICY
jgi:hypothetical protein